MKNYFILILAIIIFSACRKDNDSKNTITKDSITGFVQKGPFINGTSISINELNNDLSQTGKVFNTQITDNKGSFEFSNIGLISEYISLRADGFYFNEIIGEQSTSQITLYALSDISDRSKINVNTLSHLEKSRIEYLISQGTIFNDAKTQAQSEILKIFNIQQTDVGLSEQLDISKEGDDNAILLAISLILQGYRTEAELTQLLSDISTDIREDGELSSTALGSELINHAVFLDTSSIKNNLESRYSDLGVSSDIPDFKSFLQNFIDNTSFEISQSLIEYPTSGLYGENILVLDKTVFIGTNYSLSAELSKSTELKIGITTLEGGLWSWAMGTEINWYITQFNTPPQYFISLDSDKTCDVSIGIHQSGKFLIEYFEMGAIEPTRTKTIEVSPN